ncbi:(E3-independent) E2 ubiquitin-conjugating enzyme isoform X1 [Centruroides vittatus]|uniref:(E3-independent) E2 ubiquitin-conjugating enzyme isoform X1 n=1 Tax=Centruroides vittatus TaxID=120091 RepID=UPI0035109720
MASTCKYFDEDAVFRVNRRGLIDFGLVIENSEFISSDEEDLDEVELPEWERMKRGHVRVAWHPKGQEEVLPEKKVKLYDRSLMPGDVVRRLIKGKDTQLGYCRNTHVLAAVQLIGTKQVIPDINSKDLIPLEEFSADIAVFLDSWVGMVKIVKSDITVQCNDGSRCVLSDDDAFNLDDILDKRDRTSEYRKYSFYPGQQLWGPVHCFDKCKWLTLNKEMSALLSKPTKNIRVTVEEVKVISIGVQWLCRAYCEGNTISTEIEQPKFLIQGEDLLRVKMMHVFEPCALQIGDRNFYVIKESDKIITLEEWKQTLTKSLCPDKVLINSSAKEPENADTDIVEETSSDVLNIEQQNNINQNESDFESVDEDEEGNTSDSASQSSYSTSSSVDIGKKGSKSKSRKGPSLATKMLKKKKLKRARKKLLQDLLPLKTGDRVVTETLVTKTNADVVWQDGSIEEEIPSAALYPVHHLDGHEFFPGDFVIENKDSPRPHEYGVVKKVDHTGRTALVTWMKTYLAGSEPVPEELNNQEVSVYDIKDHPDFRYRPGSCVIRVANFQVGVHSDTDPYCTAGQVIDVYSSGQVQVSWVSGRTSLCYPQELYRVGEYDSDDLWGDDESFGDEDNDSWETESEGSIFGGEDGEKEGEDDKKAEKAIKTDKIEEKPLSTEDTKTLREKLLANIEKLRAGMARLEEVFTQNPTLQTSTVMRKLLELYKHCRLLDQLLGTCYFHERHLQYLVDRLRQRGRINSAQHVADQISRLFSVIDSEITDESGIDARVENSVNLDTNDAIKDIQHELESKINIEKEEIEIENGIDMKNRNQNELISPTSVNSSEPRNVCRQLCSILKSRLLKAHEDVEQRFGMSANSANSALLAVNDALTISEEQELKKESPPEEQELVQEQPTTVNEDSGKVVDKLELMDTAGQGIFSLLDSVPDSHKYKLSILQPTDPRAFFRTVKKEIELFKTSLPEGIIVKSFEDRMDLYSVLIKGPKRTPYEDGIFLFDFQLPADYPKIPPLCHYISYCSDRLNPNLYEGGKVCVSLLGTWGGKGTEMWCSSTSSLLQVIISIQGLILVSEPYFNEAGYERQRGTQLGRENSRMYNEMVVLKLIQSMSKLIQNPPESFQQEILEHFSQHSLRLVNRLEHWLEISDNWNIDHPTSPTSPTLFKEMYSKNETFQHTQVNLPEFPLIPASKGFCLTLKKSLSSFKEILSSAGIKLS